MDAGPVDLDGGQHAGQASFAALAPITLRTSFPILTMITVRPRQSALAVLASRALLAAFAGRALRTGFARGPALAPFALFAMLAMLAPFPLCALFARDAVAHERQAIGDHGRNRCLELDHLAPQIGDDGRGLRLEQRPLARPLVLLLGENLGERLAPDVN
jgi:hypothetical protein